MIYETDMRTYSKLKDALTELFPEIEVKLLSSDPMLKQLGFAGEVPCKIEVCATESQIEEICDTAMGFEIAAFNTTDGQYPDEDDSDYINYLKYGWLSGFFE